MKARRHAGFRLCSFAIDRYGAVLMLSISFALRTGLRREHLGFEPVIVLGFPVDISKRCQQAVRRVGGWAP
jgi:hypothetical protein